MNNTTTTKFSLAYRLGAWVARRRELRFRQQLHRHCAAAIRAAEQIPLTVRAAWARSAPDEFPGLAVDDAAWLRCSTGLAQFFEACRLQQAQGPCALPSKAADSVWHAWLRHDPAGLAAWQLRHFGRAVEHREAEALGAPLDARLARAWAAPAAAKAAASSPGACPWSSPLTACCACPPAGPTAMNAANWCIGRSMASAIPAVRPSPMPRWVPRAWPRWACSAPRKWKR